MPQPIVESWGRCVLVSARICSAVAPTCRTSSAKVSVIAFTWGAISNRRLIAFDAAGVTFRYRVYRRTGPERQQVMTLDTHEFMRRFLLHVLPRGFHRIRHYGLLASTTRKANVARARELLSVSPPAEPAEPVEPSDPLPPCPCCGGRMRIIEIFARGHAPRPLVGARLWIDTS